MKHKQCMSFWNTTEVDPSWLKSYSKLKLFMKKEKAFYFHHITQVFMWKGKTMASLLDSTAQRVLYPVHHEDFLHETVHNDGSISMHVWITDERVHLVGFCLRFRQ